MKRKAFLFFLVGFLSFPVIAYVAFYLYVQMNREEGLGLRLYNGDDLPSVTLALEVNALSPELAKLSVAELLASIDGIPREDKERYLLGIEEGVIDRIEVRGWERNQTLTIVLQTQRDGLFTKPFSISHFYYSDVKLTADGEMDVKIYSTEEIENLLQQRLDDYQSMEQDSTEQNEKP